MQLATIWEQVQRVQQELKQGSRETQDTAIAALQDTLETNSSFLFPSFVYPLLTDVLYFYCRNVLPDMGIPAEDQRFVREDFERTITHLNTQEQTAKHLEAQLKHFFLQFKSGTLDSIEDIITALSEIVATIPPLRGAGGCIPLLGGARGGLQKQFRTFKKSPFTTSHVIPFFEAMIARLPPEIKELFGYMRALFWFQLHEFVHMKAVLVNMKTKEALITRLDVTTSLKFKGLDTLDFENIVDDRMYQSCWNAVQAARTFLEDHFPDTLKDKVLRITCRFPNPTAVYNDTSASLLVCLKVIGDVLDMEIDPHTLVSGEVDQSGKVLRVDCMAEKVLAAQKHPDIHRLLLPTDGLFMTSHRVEITGVCNLAEAVAHYYGEQFQNKMKQLSRRKVLKSALALAAVPFAPVVFLAFRNIFTHPVSEHDWQLWECARELYQQKSDYRSATIILHSILDRFQRENVSTEALQLKAYALGELGIIDLQQNRKQESIALFHKAFELWKSIHDKENQADMLFRIAEVYRYTVAMDGMRKNSKVGIHYYNQANDLLSPAMERFTRIRGKCYASMGYMYYWIDEYELAERYSRKGVEIVDEVESNWSYQTCKQHLGRALIGVGDYDNAYDILESTSKAPVLQSPYYQVRSFWTMSDLFLSIGDQANGLEFAEKASQLCQEYGLQGQQRIITNILVKHQVHLFNEPF